MNLKTCMATMIFTVLSLSTAYADNQDRVEQEGFIEGRPGTLEQDQAVRNSNQPQQNSTAQTKKEHEPDDHDDHSHPVLPIPMN